MTTKIKFLHIVLLTVWLCSMICLRAAANDQLTSVTLPVTDYSQQSLSEALEPALKQVLIQLSGNPEITDLPSVQASLSTPRRYLQGYSYHQEYDSEGQMRLLVTIMFDQNELASLLPQNNQQVSTTQTDQQTSASQTTQPQILIWLKTTGKKQTKQATHPFYKEFSKLMAEQGISMLTPEMDLQDRAIVGDKQKLLFTDEAMQQFASRYAVNAVLVGDLQHKQDEWHSHWKLMWQDHSWSWHQSAGTITELATINVNRVIKHFTKQTTVSAEETSAPIAKQTTDNVTNPYEITLQISGVSSLDDYTQVMNYLRHLSVVTNVSVSHLQDDDLVLRVQTIGGKSALIAILATNPLFQPRFHNANTKTILHYQWQVNNSNSANSPEDSSPLQFIEDKS